MNRSVVVLGIGKAVLNWEFGVGGSLARGLTHTSRDASYFKVHYSHDSRNMEDTSQKRRSEMDGPRFCYILFRINCTLFSKHSKRVIIT